MHTNNVIFKTPETVEHFNSRIGHNEGFQARPVGLKKWLLCVADFDADLVACMHFDDVRFNNVRVLVFMVIVFIKF